MTAASSSQTPAGAAGATTTGPDESPGPLRGADPVAVLRQLLSEGRPWHRALLEAMGHWTLPVEYRNERRYKYVVGQEAFDWLLLAERLCAEIIESVPAEELEMLLFHGVLPEQIEPDEFRSLIGASKYQGYLNFHYGVVLEEALQLAAEESIRKRHIARGYVESGGGSEELVEDAFRHLYNDSRSSLLDEFRRSAGLARRGSLSLTDLKEFTYWLHKRRVNYWDPARVASDTRLAIRRLDALRENGMGLISAERPR